MLSRFLPLLALTLALSTGCARPVGADTPPAGAPAVALETGQQSLRIIIRLHEATEPSPALLARLGSVCAARLVHERAMSGGAHVLSLAVAQGDPRAALACIARQPEVDYAEADARARPQAR
ncbi:hypothetical protein [Derxia lacustris]|uniref:hypothetical protein n=1 Tax=Derxia lacustris TaxID=764842 RepID=UPI00111C211A|nr:hypothetical protein [Derxia lacustris]